LSVQRYGGEREEEGREREEREAEYVFLREVEALEVERVRERVRESKNSVSGKGGVVAIVDDNDYNCFLILGFFLISFFL